MLNAEHYNDPTASRAIGKAMPVSKWKSEPAYVAPKVKVDKNLSLAIAEMDMKQIKQQLKSCAKCNGDAWTCVGCVEDMGGCAFGKRAVELLDNMTKAPSESERKKALGRTKGTQVLVQKTILEYKAALDSGDPIKYIIDHANSNGTDAQKKYLARAKLRRWEKSYGALIKTDKVQVREPVAVQEFVEKVEEPHLMQMPCLSKKVAAEREEQASIKQLFCTKLDALQKACDDVQAKIDELLEQKEKYANQISAMMTTAECLGVAI